MPAALAASLLLLKQQRLRLAAALCAPFVIADYWLANDRWVLLAALRVGLCGLLWYSGQRIVRRDRLQPWVGTIGGILTSAWVVAQTWLQHEGPATEVPWSMPFIPPLGIAAALVLQDDVRGVTASTLTLALLTLGVMLYLGVPPLEVTRWMLPIFAMGVLAVWASVHFRRNQQTLEAKAGQLQTALAEERALMAELKAQRAHALHTERMALVGQLAAGVAHEVNNPLAVVKANLEYAAAEMQDAQLPPAHAAELREVFSDTAMAVERIRQVVVQLKAFAQSPDARVHPVSVSDFVHRALEMAQLRVKPPLTLIREVPVGLPRVTADAERLSQVVLGLVLNAAQALEGMRQLPAAPTVKVSARRERERVVIDVVDNGPGFPSAILEKLFTPFVTTKGEGAGMGLTLPLARDYLRSLGGNVIAENRPEGGARVSLELPLTAPQ